MPSKGSTAELRPLFRHKG